MKTAWIISLFMVLLGSGLKAQRGTNFWFAAPEVTSGHSDRPIFLRVSTYGNPANVTITQPANPAFTAISFSLAANQTQSVDLTPYITTIENDQHNTVLNYGLQIVSSSDISAYYEVKSNGNNTDIFSLKGDNALGKHFMIPSQEYWHNSNNYTPTPYSGFQIVATENNTQVTITPTADIVGHTAGNTFTINLDKGETFSVRAASTLAYNRLEGSEVQSTKPIAITISDDSGYNFIYGMCADLMGDQLIPMDVIGKEYIVVKGFLASRWGFNLPDRIYILAVENNTRIYLNGGANPSTTLNKGQQYEISLYQANIHITSNKNIYVMQISGFGCEVGMAVLPSLYCTGSEHVSFTRSKNEDFYLILLVPNGGQGQFKINGNTNLVQASDFIAVPGTGWRAARISFNNAQIVTGNNYIITNNNELFHAAIINGGASTGCMFGFFSDFKKVQTDPIYHY